MNREEMRRQIKKLRSKRANREQPGTSIPAPKLAEVKNGVIKVSPFSTKKTSLNQVKSAESSDNKRDAQAAKRRDIEIQRQAQKKSGGCGGCGRRIGQ